MLRALLAAGAAVAVAVAAADRLLAAIAIRRLAHRIQLASHASSTPQVRIAGVSFLSQLLAGRYRDIEVAVGECSLSGVDLTWLTASLSRVRAPLRELLAGAGLTASGLTATAMVPLSVLGGKLPPGLTLRLRDGNLHVSGTILRVPVLGTLGIKADPAKISFTPIVSGISAPVGFVLALPAMPPELKITSVRVTGTGLEVAVRGTDVRFGGEQPAGGQ